MSVNIACSTLECANPVIGQCTGYNKTCNKYYCREHSSDTLCAECASQKAEDEHAQLVYQEYLTLAEKVLLDPIDTPTFHFNGKELFIGGFISFAFGVVLFVFLLIASITQLTFFLPFLLIISFAFLGLPLFIVPTIWFNKRSEWISKERNKVISERVKDIEKEKVGFLQFWNVWMKQRNDEQAEKNKQALMGVLAIAGVIAAGVVGAAISESDYDRTRRAVRDELDQR